MTDQRKEAELLKQYERFKLEWMLAHGHTLDGLMKELDEILGDMEPDTSITSLFTTWEQDVGFGSAIWPCFEEWKECEGKEAETGNKESGSPDLRCKLERCLEIAMNRDDLRCQVGHIVLTLADVMRNPAYHSPTMEVWCNYFLSKNEPKGTGTHHIFLTCPRCGDRNWFKKEDGWECAACGEIADPEDMCSEAVDA